MALGEIFLSAFLGAFMKALISPDMVKFLREEGFEKKISKWGDTMKIINALLQDAEKKQKTDDAVRLWLVDLEELVYDVEDMLDEFEYEFTARKMKMDQLQHVPTSLYSCSPAVIRFRYHMWRKVNRVTNRFNQLCELRGKLGLQVNSSEASSSSNPVPQRTPTTSLPTGAVYGRAEDKKTIIELVKKIEPSDPNIQVIPIVGMGGIGKTTLAREVYNHHDLQSFEVKAWVCVSDGAFNVSRVSMSILRDITGSSSEQKDFNRVHNELKEEISGKRFLLVLDDVWNISDHNWEVLRAPFMESSPGSKIIVTTRHKYVASTFTLNGFHALDVLSDDDCWSVFLTCLFERSETISSYPYLKSIRKNVTEKCKGLPLAAKALGGLLRSEHIDDWLKILKSNLWDTLETEANEIPTALKLSYHYLPSDLKRCFSYCAIFPKSYVFEIEKIVHMWIAEGFVPQSTRNELLEETGHRYFLDLEGRSMFQQSGWKKGSAFGMHDFVHDLAEWALGKRHIRLDGEYSTDGQLRELKNVRHFSYTPIGYDKEEIFEIFQKTEGLKERIRTFLPFSASPTAVHRAANSMPLELLPELKRVRVLSLEYFELTMLSDSLGCLKHLRYLIFSCTNVKALSDSIGTLYNLQFLILNNCLFLKKLPSTFKYLLKLRHLDIEGCFSIKEMPLGMKELRNLQKLSHFTVGEDGKGSDIKELMELKMLRGKLCITRLQNVITCDDDVLILKENECLEELSLMWGSYSKRQTEEKVLGMLQPHENLKKLTIVGYGAFKFPSWVGSPSCSNIKVLKLIRCSCVTLPSLGALGSLEVLIVEDMYHLKHISLPEYLVALEDLTIENCRNLVVSFSVISLKPIKVKIKGCKSVEFDNLEVYRSISCLDLSDIAEYSSGLKQDCFVKPAVEQVKDKSTRSDEICAQLLQVGELHSIKFLTVVSISCIANTVSFPEVCLLPHLSKLYISCCDNLISLPVEMKRDNACIEAIDISNCKSLEFVVNGLLPPSLKTLSLDGCEKLKSLWDDRAGGSCSSNTKSSLLEVLRVKRCPALTCLSSIVKLPPSLKELRIRNCQQLTKLTQSNELPVSLITLEFEECPQLTTIVERFLSSNMSIKFIKIWNCEQLLQIPNRMHNLMHLQELTVGNCPCIKYFPMEGLGKTDIRKLIISSCLKLKALPTGLNSLEEFQISKCPSISFLNLAGEFPTNIKSLLVGDCMNVYTPLVKWGLQNLKSLKSFKISGFLDVEFSIPQLPNSLTELEISSFPKLKKLNGLHKVSFLKSLNLSHCSDLKSFGDEGLPLSLHALRIWYCPKLKEKCSRHGGTEWSKISHIPDVYM